MRHAAALVVLASATADATPKEADCTVLQQRLALHGIAVDRGAAVSEERVGAGDAVKCDASTRAVLSGFLVAADRIPDIGRRATRVVIDPAVAGASVRDVEVHAATGAVLVRARSTAVGDEGILMHELVHARVRGARPAATPAARLLTAVEEGVADYVAAVALGDPRVGERDGREARNLAAALAVGASEWAYLAVPGAPFDVHRFGAGLARALWRAAPGDRAVAAALVVGLAGYVPVASPSPRAALASLLGSTPSPGRAVLESAIDDWMPSELAPRRKETSR